MLKNLLKPFNQHGNILAVTFVVMAVLTFSLTTVTALTANTAGTTQYKTELISDQNIGEGLINEAIAVLKADIDANGFPTNIQIDALYTGTGLDASTSAGSLVTITDETDITSGYGDFGGIEIRIYKFDFLLDTGNYLTKYLHVTTGATSVQTFDPFDYALGTNGDLVLASGFYDDVLLFGEDIYISEIAAYKNEASGLYDLTSTANSEPSYFGTLSEISYTGDYLYCDANTCFSNGSDPIELNSGNYVPYTGQLTNGPTNSASTVNDFFGTFNYEDHLVDYVSNTAPTDGNGTITDAMTLSTLGSVVALNADPPTFKGNGNVNKWPNTPYADLTGRRDILFGTPPPKVALYYDTSGEPGGILEIDNNFTLNDTGQFDDSIAMVVDGDLRINFTGTGSIKAIIIVTGDVYIEGDGFNYEGALWVLGQTYIDFNDGELISTSGNNLGFTIMANDNIFFNSYYANHAAAVAGQFLNAFIYSEESIYVDAVNSNLHLDGALFARAQGTSGNVIPIEDQATGLPLSGLIIQSYQGYVSFAGAEVPLGGVGNVDYNGFVVQSTIPNNYEDRFMTIPTFASIITIPGTTSFFTGEFSIE